MEINNAATIEAVRAALERYEDALVNNRVDVLDELFWESPHTVRLGATENLYGIEAIREFRAVRPSSGLSRDVVRTHITAFGPDVAVAHREYLRNGKPGRQTQTWIRIDGAWKVAAAHVSNLS